MCTPRKSTGSGTHYVDDIYNLNMRFHQLVNLLNIFILHLQIETHKKWRDFSFCVTCI